MALILKSGDDLQIKFTWTDSDGTAIPLTGGTIRFKIAKKLSVSNASAEYFGSYTTFTSEMLGIHIETIPDSTTAAWTTGNYKYQARFIDSSSVVRSEDVGVCEIVSNLIDDE